MDADDERHWQELWDIADANMSCWARLVTDNRKLQADLCTLRRQYGFPLPCRDEGAVCTWVETTDPAKQMQLRQEVHDLATRYDIPGKWENALWSLAVRGPDHPGSTPAFGMGFPGGKGECDERGQWHSEIIIDSETATENPLVQEMIRWQQRHMLETTDKPPSPQPIPGNPHGKLDWQPLREWHKKHPSVTLGELAAMLSYSPGYIRDKVGSRVDV